MWSRHWADRYWPDRYWPNVGDVIVVIDATADVTVVVRDFVDTVVVPESDRTVVVRDAVSEVNV